MNLLSEPNKVSSNYNQDWYFEKTRSSDTLIITAGDSWTYGGSIKNNREEKIYGSLLAQEFKADFINIGFCGGSNLDIVNATKYIVGSLKKEYNKIFLIFTLTESTRDLCIITQFPNVYNNLKGKDWPHISDLNLNNINKIDEDNLRETLFYDTAKLWIELRGKNNIKDIISTSEKVVLDSIDNLKHDTNNFVKLCGRNFSHFLNPRKNCLEKIWTEIISEKGGMSSYPKSLLFLTSKIGSGRLIEYQKKFNCISNFKTDLELEVEKALKGIEWLCNSKYNSNIATKHPLETAHRWYMEYILENIKYNSI
jgi:hypothetical protein